MGLFRFVISISGHVIYTFFTLWLHAFFHSYSNIECIKTKKVLKNVHITYEAEEVYCNVLFSCWVYMVKNILNEAGKSNIAV
jgi:hypothetical protein